MTLTAHVCTEPPYLLCICPFCWSISCMTGGGTLIHALQMTRESIQTSRSEHRQACRVGMLPVTAPAECEGPS